MVNKFLVIGAMLLFGSNAFSATGSGNVSNLCKIGGNYGAVTSSTIPGVPDYSINVTTTNINSLKALIVSDATSGGVAGNFYGFYDGMNQYVVPAGKHFIICGMHILMTTAINLQFQFGFATVPFPNNTASASQPSGSVYYGPGTAVTDGMAAGIPVGYLAEYMPIGGISFPMSTQTSSGSNVYPWFRSNTGSNGKYVTVYGFEI
jgi:hypothetical protein